MIFLDAMEKASMGEERAENCLEQQFRSQWTVVYTHNTP